jgi:hypothetical protein
MGLPGPYLSLDEIGERIVDTIEDGERYSMPSWPFRLSPRRFSGWPGRESAARSGDLELPSAHMADTFWQISPVMRALRSARSDWLESAQRHARSWERRLLDDIERRQQAATGNIAMTIPHRPVVVQPAGSIAYPPPTSIALPMIGKRAVKKLIFRR